MYKEKSGKNFRTFREFLFAIPIFQKYPCKEKEEEKEKGFYSLPCREISISIPEVKEHRHKKEGKRKKKEKPVEYLTKERYEEFKRTKICWIPYRRPWCKWQVPIRQRGEFSKFFCRRRKTGKARSCVRELDEYEEKLWIPICEKEEKSKEEYKKAIDANVCVFCLGCLLRNGYVCDLFENVPKIKKQSEKYGDDISERIGFRSRITVHKKCYVDYIDVIKRKKEKGDDYEEEEEEEEEEDDEDDDNPCEVKKKEKEDNENKDKNKINEKKHGIKAKAKKQKVRYSSELRKKTHFCLKKFQIPQVAPGTLAFLFFQCYLLLSSPSTTWNSCRLVSSGTPQDATSILRDLPDVVLEHPS